jgi:hypothetical protein
MKRPAWVNATNMTLAYRAVIAVLLATNIWLTLEARDSADDARSEAVEAKNQASYCIQR